MHYSQLDVINIFKVVKGQRPVKKIPKLTNHNLLQVQNLTDNFNTKWSNIIPSLYFECGLNLMKSFSYGKFMEDFVLTKYIQRDKQMKRRKVDKEVLERSFRYIKNQHFKSLDDYVGCSDDHIHMCSLDYFHNKIDKVLMAFLMFKKYFKATELDKRYTNHIWDNKDSMKQEVRRWGRMIVKLEKEIL